MLKCIGYKNKIAIFRHHIRKIFVPIYKDLGKGATSDKIKKEKSVDK